MSKSQKKALSAEALAAAQAAARQAAYQRGVVIFVLLAVLTGIEYVVGAFANLPVVLVLFAIIKAGLVLYFFMHISRLFNLDAEGDH